MVSILQHCRLTSLYLSPRLPDRFVFSEEPTLAQWDGDKSCWRTSGFKEVTCDLGVCVWNVELGIH